MEAHIRHTTNSIVTTQCNTRIAITSSIMLHTHSMESILRCAVVRHSCIAHSDVLVAARVAASTQTDHEHIIIILCTSYHYCLYHCSHWTYTGQTCHHQLYITSVASPQHTHELSPSASPHNNSNSIHHNSGT